MRSNDGVAPSTDRRDTSQPAAELDTSSAAPGRVLGPVSAALAVSTALVLVSLLWLTPRGYDLTDEGFYLNWLANPGLYPATTLQFGFLWHPIHDVLGGDIALLRALNVLLVLGLGWWVGTLALRRTLAPGDLSRWQRLALGAALGTCAIGIFNLGLVTPNYNALAFQGLLVTSAGVMLAVGPRDDELARTRSVLGGWAIVGVGGWLTLAGKPTSAAMLALLAGLALLVAGRERVRGMALAVVVAGTLTLIGGSIIDGSPRGFVRRLTDGVELSAALEASHTLSDALRWEPYQPGGRLLLVLGLVAAAIVLATLSGAITRRAAAIAAIACLGTLITTFLLTRGDVGVIAYADPFSASLLLALPLAAAALLALLARRLHRPHRADIVLPLLLLLLPFAYCFGTNTSYWRAAGQAGIFWVLAGVLLVGLLPSSSWRRTAVAGLAVAGQTLTILLAVPALETPYRQPGPIWGFDTTAEIRDSRLLLDSVAARHLTETTAAARAGGLEPGTPVYDLTGRSPGLLYAWDATSIAAPWSLGGYPGTAAVEELVLGRVPCAAVARMWLLAEPGGPREVPSEVLRVVGADAEQDYRIVAAWEAPDEVTTTGAITQELRAPTRGHAAATAACDAARAGQATD